LARIQALDEMIDFSIDGFAVVHKATIL
jgi:hypothetical protein